MRETEILELNTLLKRYKEHLCLLYKDKNSPCRCGDCREAEYNEYEETGKYICGVENFAENFREEFKEDVDFPEKEG